MLRLATSGLSVAAGIARSSTRMVGAPPEVRLITALVRCLMRGRKRPNASGDWSGRPVSGLRACRCTMAAPASEAPTAASTISSGVTGRCGDIDGVWIAPVTAQVMMTLRLAMGLLAGFFPSPALREKVPGGCGHGAEPEPLRFGATDCSTNLIQSDIAADDDDLARHAQYSIYPRSRSHASRRHRAVRSGPSRAEVPRARR